MRHTLRQAKFSFVVLLALVISACGNTAGLISAPAIPESGLLTEPTIALLPERIASAIPPIDPDSFAGNWEGRDPGDGSKVTLSIVQIDITLTGIFRDWYTGPALKLGFQGKGSGATRSATSAKMTFFLSRSDGMAVRVTAWLTLSNKGSTLTFTFSGDNSTLLHRR